MGRKYQLSTLGCKVNQYESQQLRELLESLGFSPAGPGETPDLAVVNTCAVTGGACRKSRQIVRQAARQGGTPVFVVGCSASADADRLQRVKGVTATLGHERNVRAELRQRIRELFDKSPTYTGVSTNEAVEGPRERPAATGNDEWMSPIVPLRTPFALLDSTTSFATAILSGPAANVKPADADIGRIERFDGHHRAFLKVQDGCDAHCTYCIIPRLRPRLASKPLAEAVSEAEHLVRSGHREIVLTGIFLGAYGHPTAIRRRQQPGATPLARLVDALAGVPGLCRLRLSSLEPGDVDDALLDALARHPACVPHLHLPLQSGSGAILRRMNRQYSVEEFLEMVERVRRTLARPAITTDIIVGFPGETEADFERTLEVARLAGFLKIHAFPFSPREKTAAARWRDLFVPPTLVRERMERLATLEQETSLSFRRQAIGAIERVLVEVVEDDAKPLFAGAASTVTSRSLRNQPRRVCHGRSDRYFEVYFDDPDAQPNDVVAVRVDRATPARTHGTLVGRLKAGTGSEAGRPRAAVGT